MDLSSVPLNDFSSRVPDFPKENLLHKDFFELQSSFDLIVEQTMFCAISPSLRKKYAQKSSELLSKNGKLVGVFFNRAFEGGPPFGGSKEEYQSIFTTFFKVTWYASCNHIIPVFFSTHRSVYNMIKS